MLVAKAFGAAPKYRVLSRPMIRLAGWFKPPIAESYEMLYQNDSPYLFDSSKFARELGFGGTPYADGIRITAGSFQKDNVELDSDLRASFQDRKSGIEDVVVHAWIDRARVPV